VADAFVFHAGDGADVVTDFSSARGDMLKPDDAIWGGGMARAQVVATFASVQADGVHLDFGAGRSIVLTGLTTTAGLADPITIIRGRAQGPGPRRARLP
jgi:hypothetical protein